MCNNRPTDGSICMYYPLLIYFIVVFYWMNIVTFGLYGWDKHQAVYQRWRVPEAVLILFSLFCGAWGGVMGMLLFKHKTRHTLFLICNPLFLLLQLAAGFYLFYKCGISTLSIF